MYNITYKYPVKREPKKSNPDSKNGRRKENGDPWKQVEDLHEKMRKWKDSDGEEKLFLVGHLNHILRRTGMWRDEEDMTEWGKAYCFENFFHEELMKTVTSESRMRVEGFWGELSMIRRIKLKVKRQSKPGKDQRCCGQRCFRR
jgi:hypothetical protein